MCCYVGCSNSHIYVYNLRSRLLLRVLTHATSSVNDLYMSPDDYFLFSASEVCLREFSVSKNCIFIYLRMQYMY